VARPRQAGRAVVTLAALAALAGCAAVPTSGKPRQVTGATGQAQQFVQPIPPRPQPGWQPQEVVEGFLAASASFAGNHAAARQYLTPAAQRSFHGSWAVTVVSGQSTQSTAQGPPNQGGIAESATVILTGQQLATISDIGQYFDNPGSHQYKFGLIRSSDGQWFIATLPPKVPLLLTQAEFEQVYQPRNLYFWARSELSLVPEPVFAPQQDTVADVATNLVKALLRNGQRSSPGQPSWLADATTTSFPRGTTLAQKVTITGSTATVNLSGTVARSSFEQLRNMAAQLITTLTRVSYGQPPIAKSVQIEVNGHPKDAGREQSGDVASLPYAHSPAAPLYYLAANHTVDEWTGSQSQPVRNPAGHGQVPFSQIAVQFGQPSGQFAGAAPTSSGAGCTVYYGALPAAAPLSARTLPDAASGPCTSVSWDISGDIWAVTASGVWVLPPGSRQPELISLPTLPGTGSADYQVLALRVAPDGVRVAMLVQSEATGKPVTQVMMAAARPGAGSQVLLGPAVALAPGLADPVALSWFDPDHLVVLAQSELNEVPVNGGAVTPLEPASPGADTVTAAGPGKIAVSDGTEILTSSGPEQVLANAVKGAVPAYPE
jgi:hypothetical protein